jgi:hypothetical protein
MSVADELQKLSEQHKAGSLTDAEFADAKRKILDQAEQIPLKVESGDLLGTAANRYVTFQIVLAIIGFILAAYMIFGVIIPHSHPPR